MVLMQHYLCLALCISLASAVCASVHVLSNNRQQQQHSREIERLCVLDALQIVAECAGMSEVQLQVWRQAATAVLYSNESARCGQEQSVAIDCALNADHCTPSVTRTSLNATANILSVYFDTPTTMPKLMTRIQIAAVLMITPQPHGAMVGDWIAEDQLDISLDDASMQRLLAARNHNELIVVVHARKQRRPRTDQAVPEPIRLRFTEHGGYLVALVRTGQSLAFFNVSVSFCSDATVFRRSEDRRVGKED